MGWRRNVFIRFCRQKSTLLFLVVMQIDNIYIFDTFVLRVPYTHHHLIHHWCESSIPLKNIGFLYRAHIVNSVLKLEGRMCARIGRHSGFQK